MLDKNIALSLIYKLIENSKSDYFKYLNNTSESLDIIYDYFVRLETNEKDIDNFSYSKEKTDALNELFTSYKNYKITNNIANNSDVLDISIEFVSEYLEQFDAVFIDDFKISCIELTKNKKEKILLESISNHKSCKEFKKEFVKSDNKQYQNFAFNFYDEVRTAIKISKKLMLEDETLEDEIVIVTSNFPQYAPYYKNLLDEYGMKGYDTVGTPLHTISSNDKVLKSHDNFSVQKAYYRFDEKYKKIVSNLNYFGLDYDNDNLKQNLLLNTNIREPKQGILIADINNFIGLNKTIKHIIFIGSDITHFPPSNSINFLYTQEEAIKLFNMNNIYDASVTLYDELKRLSENLYIVTAQYQDKRKISQSIIIDKNINNIFDISDIKSRNDELKDKNYIEEPSLQDKQNSVISNEFTLFDGLDIGSFTAGDKLSASALNSYEKCPMNYYFTSVLKLNAPQDETDGFDAAQKGSLMHLCFELFVDEIQKFDSTNLTQDELYSFMLDMSQKAYIHKDTQKDIGVENINHKIELKVLQKGLDNINSVNKSELAKFVDYFYKNKFEQFKNSNTEELFMLDKNFAPVDLQGLNHKDEKNKDKLKHIDDSSRFIKGFIDRLDNLDEEVNIIDYKSSVKSKNIKDFKADSLKDYQLGIYMLYATQKYPDKSYNAHLLSFKESDKPTTQEYNTSISIPYDYRGVTIEFDENYIETIKKQIKNIQSNINSGKFNFNNSDEKVCGYCNYKHICHQEVLNKDISNAN